VILGDPNRYEPVNTPYQSRFQRLNEKQLDLLLEGDAHTIQREVREVSFRRTISIPIMYTHLTTHDSPSNYRKVQGLVLPFLPHIIMMDYLIWGMRHMFSVPRTR